MRYLILILISIFSFLVFASLPPTRLKGGNEAALATTFNFDVGAIPVTRTGTSVVFGTLPVSGGGTGLTTLTAYNLLSGSGTTVNQIAPAASGTILFSTGGSSFPTFRALVGLDVTTALGYTPVASVSSTAPITITGGASNPVIGLATSGVTSGTYPKVTVDSFGRVTSGSVLNSADVVTGLGYTPVASVSATAPLFITGGASNPVISLSTTGVTSGASFAKVFVDGYGRVTSGTSLVNADLPDSGIVASTYTKLTVNSKGVATSGTTLLTSDLPNSGVVSGTYTKVQVTSAGTVTSGTTLVESDIPSLQTTKITSGVFGVDRGGTGLSTTSTGALIIGSGTTTYITLPASTTGTYLKMGTSSPEWTTVTPGSVSSTTYQRFTSGSGTYTTPAGAKQLRVRMVGGGGGSAGSASTAAGVTAGGNGGDSTFGALTANGGSGAQNSGGAGGSFVVGAPWVNVASASGNSAGAGYINANIQGGVAGAPSFFGGGGQGIYNGVGGVGNFGGGGGGSGVAAGGATGGGGGSGGYNESTVTTPAASYAFTVGAGGTAGTAGSGGFAGAAGGAGMIIVEESY